MAKGEGTISEVGGFHCNSCSSESCLQEGCRLLVQRWAFGTDFKNPEASGEVQGFRMQECRTSGYLRGCGKGLIFFYRVLDNLAGLRTHL